MYMNIALQEPKNGPVMKPGSPRLSKLVSTNPKGHTPGRLIVWFAVSFLTLEGVVNLAIANPAGTIHYPDLQTLPPSDVGVYHDQSTGKKLFRFSNTIANLGEGPLTLIPRNNLAKGGTDAYQVLWSHDQYNNWYAVSTNYVGTFVYNPNPVEPGWTFTDFATYELHNVAGDGSVGSTVLASMAKMSCCVGDDILVNPNLQHTGSQTYSYCTRTNPQGISVGWADVYGWSLPGQMLDITGIPNGDYWLVTIANPDHLINEGGGAAASNNSAFLKIRIANDIVWVDDAVPGGALADANGGDAWNWVSSNPTPYSGRLAHQSAIRAGTHQHYFYGATATLTVNPSNVLITYIYVDPANLPSEVMLQWSDGNSWEHRAYWGANKIGYGTLSYMGPLPPAGKWVRLEVPASQVGLEGVTLSGMSFALYNGGETWDYAGLNAVAPGNPPPPDTTPPTVTITAPVNDATVAGTITVSADASDNVGVAGVQFELDGANLGSAAASAPYRVSWNTATSANG